MPPADWTRAGAAAGAVSAALAGAAAGVYGAMVRRPLPRRTGKVPLRGLTDPVDVVVDTWGVPHVYASSMTDLMRAQGYLHAQDRLWQLEVNRRIVAGRLAEVLGEPAVPLDRWMRTLGLRRAAEGDAGLLDAQEWRLLEAYAAGVNERIAEGRLPVEFTLLRHRPRPWRALDSLSWSTMMAFTLSVNWAAEIVRARIVDRLGPDLAADLEPPYAAGRPLIVADGVHVSRVGAEVLRQREQGPTGGAVGVDGPGSNAWVVHGSRTSSGAPILANDMHLGLTIPGIWYENHLCAPGYEVTGVSFPGVPGVVAGHTTRVAWGFSTGLADVQDLYVERLRHRDDGGVEYEFEGSWHPADVRREVIRVRRGGGRPAEVVETVVTTRHGPIINVLAPELTGEQPLALRWTGYEPSAMFRTLLDMNRARSCEQMRAALRGWHTPVQNVVYADVDGDIGHTYAGRVPIRARGDGRLPVPGWTGEYEWTGYVPYEDLPHQHNPPSGYIAAANNQVVGAAYPYWLGADFDTGNRAERIAELIGAAGTMDVATCRAMQLDQVSTSGRRTAAALWGLASPDPAVDEALRLMDGWDGQLGSDSPQAAIYAVFSATLARRLLRPRLGELTEPYTGHGVTPVLAESSILAERCREWLDATLLDPTSRWWDTADGQTREGHILAAMADTVATLTRRFGADPVRWRWGRLHTLTLRHMLGTRAPLDRLLNRGPYPMGGDRDTLWKAQIARHDPQTDGVMTGPPFRFIADLGNLGQSRGQLMPGQSGQVGSPHYADGIGSWLRGDHHPMLLDRAAVEGNAEARFVLVP